MFCILLHEDYLSSIFSLVLISHQKKFVSYKKKKLMIQVIECDHVFCKNCLIDYASSLGRMACPSCSELVNADFISSPDAGNQTGKTTVKGFKSSSILNRIQLENFRTSTKIEALVCLICSNYMLLCFYFVHM